MNERIRELADKVADIMPTGVYNLRYESGKRGVEFTEDALEKFALLIVRECATVITNDDLAKDCGTFLMQSWAKGMRYSAHLIKEHFGVEE